MKKFFASAVAILAIAAAAPAFAQDATSVSALVKIDIKQPSLFDPKDNDVFKGVIDDASGTTSFEVKCSAGASGKLGFGRVDERCAVKGHGDIKNPKNPSQVKPRINYAGGFTIEAKKDGYTDAGIIKAEYLRVGSAPADSGAFGGNLVMKPEKPSATARALGDRLLNYVAAKTAGTNAVEFDTKIDAIRFEGFVVPHAGQLGGKSCAWTGDQIYAYVNESWTMSFDVACGDQKYKLEGNMPLVDVTGMDHQQEYRLSLVVPGEGGADPFAEADPFSNATGVTGVFKLKNSGRSTDGGVFENVKVEGMIEGNGVPLELVRGYGQIMVVLARTFYGE